MTLASRFDDKNKKTGGPFGWFRDWFEPMPDPAEIEARLGPKPAPAAKPAPPKPEPPPAPGCEPITNPVLEGAKSPPRTGDEVSEAIRDVNTAVVALTQLESSSTNPAHSFIANAGRRALAEAAQVLYRLQRGKKR